eukprot:TRINITY_DN16010_c0_g1_i1.p1 TRINITY_DN16010_c0_g1~~TRINITY_DN16010_c0_g1_i1.p1  ORF type:complete len:108 (+),score=12.90 TRINITY_DN16010_c0_g1_i1:248-571(+)
MLPELAEKDVTQKHIDMQDHEFENIMAVFDEAHNFIDSVPEGKACFVHCDLGISRSSTIVISYLMKTQNMKFQEAMKFVSDCRPQVWPNPGFVLQLKHYEKMLNGEA